MYELCVTSRKIATNKKKMPRENKKSNVNRHLIHCTTYWNKVKGGKSIEFANRFVCLFFLLLLLFIDFSLNSTMKKKKQKTQGIRDSR